MGKKRIEIKKYKPDQSLMVIIENIFKTKFILLFVIFQEAVKSISSIFFLGESLAIVVVRFLSLYFGCFLAYFVYKNNAIAIAFFCIQLFIIGAIGILQNILYLQSINILAKILFLILSLYYVASSIVITRRSKIQNCEKIDKII